MVSRAAASGAADDDALAMPFGKFKGVAVAELPISYIVWLLLGPNTHSRSVLGNYRSLQRQHPRLFFALCNRLLDYVTTLRDMHDHS